MPLLLHGFTDHRINTGEIEIGYSVGPDNGPTLLLLHGATSRRDGFMNVVEPLSKNHRIVTMDQRGHGYSGHTPGHYQREDHVRDIKFILDNVCKEPSILWGHSMGGGNAASTTADHPDLVTALVLEDAGMRRRTGNPSSNNTPTASVFRQHLELIDSGLSLEQLTEKVREMSPGQPDYYAGWKAECLLQLDTEIIRNSVSGAPRGGDDPADILARINVPVLFMQADPASGGSNTDEYAAEILPKRDNFTLKKIVGAGHNINREHTELLLPVVLPWLESLQQA